jgi:hypothetical protein
VNPFSELWLKPFYLWNLSDAAFLGGLIIVCALLAEGIEWLWQKVKNG